MTTKIARVEPKFQSPGPHPNGIQASPEGLWCIDQGNHKVTRQDWDTGKVNFEAQTDTVHSSGITLGGGYLWIASTYEVKIAKLDPETGKTIAKYDSPGAGIVAWRQGAPDAGVTGAHGLEWKDGKLYVASPPSQHIHVMDPETWTEIHSFRAPGLRVHGLAWGRDGFLWSADTSAGTVNLLDPADGRVMDVLRVEAPVEVHALTIYQDVLWYADAETCQIGRLIVEG